MAECDYDVTQRRAELIGLDLLPTTEVWRRLKQSGHNRRYRRYTYKYRAFDPTKLRDILIESRLWLSSPAAFNDPFELRPHVVFEGTPEEKRSALMARMKVRFPGVGYVERAKRVEKMLADASGTLKVARAAVLKLADSSGICSFADDPTSILMWGHYAANHSGVCIQFEISGSPSRLLAAISVDYSDEYPTINWTEDTAAQLGNIILRKSRHWSYERERRIICPDCAGKTYWFRPRACTGVIVGCVAPPEVVQFLRECNVERRKRDMPPLRLYRAVRSDDKYKLILHRMHE